MAGYIDCKLHTLQEMEKVEEEMSVVVDRFGDVWTHNGDVWSHPSWEVEVCVSEVLLAERGPLQLIWTAEPLSQMGA